jgi:hypothetical protein
MQYLVQTKPNQWCGQILYIQLALTVLNRPERHCWYALGQDGWEIVQAQPTGRMVSGGNSGGYYHTPLTIRPVACGSRFF